jgi:hypothetical protein
MLSKSKEDVMLFEKGKGLGEKSSRQPTYLNRAKMWVPALGNQTATAEAGGGE